MKLNTRVAAVAAAVALAGAIGIASAQNSATDQSPQVTAPQGTKAIPDAQSSQGLPMTQNQTGRSRNEGRNPSAVEIDNGNKAQPADRGMRPSGQSNQTTQPSSSTADTMTSEPPKADRN